MLSRVQIRFEIVNLVRALLTNLLHFLIAFGFKQGGVAFRCLFLQLSGQSIDFNLRLLNSLSIYNLNVPGLRIKRNDPDNQDDNYRNLDIKSPLKDLLPQIKLSLLHLENFLLIAIHLSSHLLDFLSVLKLLPTLIIIQVVQIIKSLRR